MGWFDIFRAHIVEGLVRSGELTRTPTGAARIIPGTYGLTRTQAYWKGVHQRRYKEWEARILYVVGWTAVGAGLGWVVGRYAGAPLQVWYNLPWIGGRALLSVPLAIYAPDPYTALVAGGGFHAASIALEAVGVWKQAKEWARQRLFELGTTPWAPPRRFGGGGGVRWITGGF